MNKRSTRILSVLLVFSIIMMLMANVIMPIAASEGLTLETMPSVQEAATSNAVNFKISSVEDLVFAGKNEALFDANDTLYLANDINLLGNDTFLGFEGLKASFDGLDHMIYNWEVACKGLFYNCPTKSIQNLKLYKVKLDPSGLGGGQWPALVFGMQQTELSTLSTTFTMKNIHVEESELVRPSVKDTGAAILLSRYRVNALVTVNITDCSVVNTVITGTSPLNNVGAVMGGISNNNSAGSAFNLKNIYINGFQHLNAANHCGILLGEVRKNVTAENIAIFNSSLEAFGNENGDVCDASILGRAFADTSSFKNILMAGNTLSSEEGSCFIMAKNGSPALTITNAYCDDSILTAVEGGTQTVNCVSSEAFKSGEVAYLAQATDSYWTMKDGLPALGTFENQVRKIIAGDTVVYANGGEETDLSLAMSGMVFSGGALDESATKLTVTAADVTLQAYSADTPAGKVAVALAYFGLRDTKYYADGLADAIAAAEAKLAAGTATFEDAAVLMSYKENYKPGLAAPDLPAVSDYELYPGLAGYMIFDAGDLLAANNKELTKEQTLYLGADLDLANVEFDGLRGVSYSFDGMGKTISNWTAESRGLFDWYRGTSIRNLNLKNIALTWPTSDGAGLVVGRRYTAPDAVADFSMKNVHVSDSTVTNAGNVVEDGGAILLGVMSRPLNSDASDYFTFGSGKTVAIDQCSVVNTTIDGNAHQRIAAVIGHAWGGFNYELSNVVIREFENCTNEIAGLILGEAEGSTVKLSNVGIFDSTGADTAITYLGEGAVVTAENLLAAGNDADLTAGVSYQNCYADVEGAILLSAAAFKNGEAAWKVNKAVGAAVWYVGEVMGYPTPMNSDSTAVPYRITLQDGDKEEQYYTNANGAMLLSEAQQSAVAKKLAVKCWVYGEMLIPVKDTAAIFAADTVVRALADGDLNGDGTVGLQDVILLLQHLVGYDIDLHASADLNDDGKVSVFDAVLLLKKITA